MMFFAAVNLAPARRLRLMTSYFVPTPALVTALLGCSAPRGRCPDHLSWKVGQSCDDLCRPVGLTTRCCRRAAGFGEYRRGMMHAKTITVDDDWSLVGSPNLDARSLLLNFEMGWRRCMARRGSRS